MDNTLNLRAFDRRLFLVAAVLFPLIVFVGFAPTYYAKPWFATPPLASILVHVHGATRTLWVVLFVAQVWLIAAGHVNTHRRLGGQESGSPSRSS